MNFEIRFRQWASKNWLIWLRWIYVLGVPIIALGLGFIAAKRSPKYALVASLLPVVLVCAELILRWLHYSPIVLLLAACFIPFSLPTGTGSPVMFSLLLTVCVVALWVLRMIVVDKRLRLYASPVNVPLLGFMLTTIISLVWSNLFRDPLVVIWKSFPLVQIASALVMIMLPVAFFITANHISHVKALKVLVFIMLLAGYVGLIRQYGRIHLPVDVNGLFSMWIIGLSIGLAIFVRNLSRWVRGLLLLLAGLWIYYGFVLYIGWVAGWLPGLLVAFILAFMRTKKWAILLAVVMLIFVGVNSSYYLGTVLQSENRQSGETRLAAWEMNWRITSQHLLFGTGPAGYAAYYMSYFPTEATASHSNYIDIIAQTGVTGFIFSIWFFISLAIYGYRLALRLRGRGDFLEGLANVAFAGTIGCIVMMGFGDWLFPFAYTQTIAGFNYAIYNWIFMGTLLAIDRLTKEKAEAHA